MNFDYFCLENVYEVKLSLLPELSILTLTVTQKQRRKVSIGITQPLSCDLPFQKRVK